ncbi:pantoate--beta-alanine ligase [Candidatus Saganbacteria bacterium]|nr:pantoate--beta-alanine ligase [Candidatus Saganbacteria bacterium]
MKLIKDPQGMHSFSLKAKYRGKTIGFVPTMGYLHEGHLSLVEAARGKSDVVIVSIFVNPLQFGANEDFDRYPRDFNHDKKQLQNFDVDVLFIPSRDDIYQESHRTFVDVEGLSKRLCGISRPALFRGVTTILAKFFNIVSPDFVFMGEKDFQQLLIVRQMVRDLNLPVEVIGLPTVREFDGLAMSSRNKYLSPKERQNAAVLCQALNLGRQEIEKGERDKHKLLLRLRSLVGTIPSIRLDYLVMVDPDTLAEKKDLNGRTLLALAAYFGKTRLIDNILVEAK